MRSLGSFATSTIKQLCSEMGSRHDSAFGNHTTPVLSKIPPARYCTNRENRSRNDKERHCPPREWKLTALMHLERLLSATSALCYTRSCYQYAFIYSVSTTRLYEYHSSTLSNCIWVPANTKCQPSTQSHTPEVKSRHTVTDIGGAHTIWTHAVKTHWCSGQSPRLCTGNTKFIKQGTPWYYHYMTYTNRDVHHRHVLGRIYM